MYHCIGCSCPPRANLVDGIFPENHHVTFGQSMLFLPANFVCSVFCIVLFMVLGAFLIVVSFQTQVNPAAEGLFRGKQVFLGLQ